MSSNILYLNANGQIVKNFKERFESIDRLELISAASCEEAFSIMKDMKIDVFLVDSHVPGMRITDLIARCERECPEMAVNVCLDVDDPTHLQAIVKNQNVYKVYPQPWEIERIIEGIEATIDAKTIRDNLNRTDAELNEEELQIETTIVKLRETLKQQQYSYYKLGRVLNCIETAFTKISNAEILSEEDLHSAGHDDASEAAKERFTYVAFVRDASQRLLRLLTATSFEGDKLDEVARREILDAVEGGKMSLKLIENCLNSDVQRFRAADICFAFWTIGRLLRSKDAEGKISITSRYVTSNKCEYKFKLEGFVDNSKCPKENEYVEQIIGTLTDMMNCNEEENGVTYVMYFSL